MHVYHLLEEQQETSNSVMSWKGEENESSKAPIEKLAVSISRQAAAGELRKARMETLVRAYRSTKGPFSSKGKKNLDVSSYVWPDVGRVFRTLIKKLIPELTWKQRDEFFEAFDRIISTWGYCSTYG